MYVFKGNLVLFLLIVLIFLYVDLILLRFCGFKKCIKVLIIFLNGFLFFVIIELLGNDIWLNGVWFLFGRGIEWLMLELNRIGVGFIGIIIWIKILLFFDVLIVFMVFINFFLMLFFILRIIFLLLLGIVRLKYLKLFVFLVSWFLI